MTDKKFTVVESNDTYIVCHGSGLTWAEAHLMVLSKMFEDAESGNDKLLQNVSLFELEANEPGFGVSFEYGNMKTTYYILDEPNMNRD